MDAAEEICTAMQNFKPVAGKTAIDADLQRAGCVANQSA
jgi:hypothetical protein